MSDREWTIGGGGGGGGVGASGALAAIRKLHTPKVIPWPYFRRYDSPTHITGCDHCNGQWPCDTARLCYTDDEIKEMTNERADGLY